MSAESNRYRFGETYARFARYLALVSIGTKFALARTGSILLPFLDEPASEAFRFSSS